MVHTTTQFTTQKQILLCFSWAQLNQLQPSHAPPLEPPVAPSSASHIAGLLLALGADPDRIVPPAQWHFTFGWRAFITHTLPAGPAVVNGSLKIELLLADDAGLDLVIWHPVLGTGRIFQDTWGKGAGHTFQFLKNTKNIVQDLSLSLSHTFQFKKTTRNIVQGFSLSLSHTHTHTHTFFFIETIFFFLLQISCIKTRGHSETLSFIFSSDFKMKLKKVDVLSKWPFFIHDIFKKKNINDETSPFIFSSHFKMRTENKGWCFKTPSCFNTWNLQKICFEQSSAFKQLRSIV